MTAFSGLKGQVKIVAYYGSYEHHDGIDIGTPTYNIILEYGELDLWQYMFRNDPPESDEEVETFWESVVLELAYALASFYRFELYLKPYRA